MTSYGLLVRQFTHVVWADETCLAAAETVPGERRGENFGFSFGSVHATLVHMLGAQATWLGRLNGDVDLPFPDPIGLPTLKAVGDRWNEVHDGWRTYLASLTDNSLDGVMKFRRREKTYEATRLLVCLLVVFV